ncbi:hypothetical protein QBC43DRAFT_339390 [Cladorrhinum sp. PSN259]|nr:hypothetical protein QBC43DRAFT_339390 [Cladorrhinum sp. PSN259]
MRFTQTAILLTTAVTLVAAGPAPGPAPAALITPGPIPFPAAQLQGRQDLGLPTPQILPSPQDQSTQPPSDPSTSTNSPSQESSSPSQILAGTITGTGTETCLPSLSALLAPFPTPPPQVVSWSSAAILSISSIIMSQNLSSFPSALKASSHVPGLCTAAASGLAPMPTQDKDLAKTYSAFLDKVQMWRFAVEGDAYLLAGRCGGMVGLALELLMATEAPMCVSGIRQTVRPWATGGSDGGIKATNSTSTASGVVSVRRGVEGVVRVGVVVGLLVGVLFMGGM